MVLLEPTIVGYTLKFNMQGFQARYRFPNCAELYLSLFMLNLQPMPKTDSLKKEGNPCSSLLDW